ncbi:MAG: hypothetical protein UHT92_06845, partial [Prevotella sp.]|nr:hypothetical protein [Prevotella sp.]
MVREQVMVATDDDNVNDNEYEQSRRLRHHEQRTSSEVGAQLLPLGARTDHDGNFNLKHYVERKQYIGVK